MRTLLHTLQDQDIGYFRIIAELWGLDLPKGSTREVAEALAQEMTASETLGEIIDALPDQASEALQALGQLGGRSPWNGWDRKYGPLRAMGPGRRDREQPWREPSSVCEVLWYRGLLGRAFIDTAKGPEEYAYIPQELFAWLQHQPQNDPVFDLDQISAPAYRIEAAATIIDDCTTLLAALRRQIKPTTTLPESLHHFIRPHLIHPDSLDLCLALVRNIGLLTAGSLETDLEAVREFLLSDRVLSLQKLYTTWKNSTRWNDLAELPGIRSGGDSWPNDAKLARETLIRWLGKLQVGQWYSLSSLIRAIYEDDPAFQRPGGNFDTWYLHDSEGYPLNGIEHWYAIEGALLQSLLKGPLRWFGVVQLGHDKLEGPVTSFRSTQLSRLLEDPHSKLPLVAESGKATIRADGQISVPRLAPRATRYQLARILDWGKQEEHNYHYRLSVRAIREADRQNLNLNQVRAVLTQASETDLPPSVLQALQRLEHQSYSAKINQHHLLMVSDETIMESIRSHPSTKRFLHKVLNEKTAVVRSDQWEQLIQAAGRMGILIDGLES